MELDLNVQEGSIGTRIDQVKSVYLFMSLEGEISKDNEVRIKELANDLKLSISEFPSIVRACENIIGLSFDNDDRFDTILEHLVKFGKEKSESEKVQILWLLVNCAFYDGEYNQNKKRFLRKLSRLWEIENNVVILSEMEDTAETLLDLEKHKEWIKTTNYPYDYTHSVVEELDKNKQELANNISLLVSIG